MANYMGLALPGRGPGTWNADAATDQLILTMAASHSVNPLVVKNSSGTALFSVTKNGNLLPRIYTTLPTTGLTQGEMILAFAGTVPKLGFVYSTANGIKLIKARSKTLATLTA